MTSPNLPQSHSSAWVAQTWISFALSMGVTALGIWFLPTVGPLV
ncbi:MAG: YiaA/YiaB family inner membrane protein [Myxococcaceae bacterium]